MDRDRQILEHIIGYIEDIEKLTARFNADIDLLKTDIAYEYSVSHCLLQIGELSIKLSDNFKTETQDKIPWREIRGLRNFLAHDYGSVDMKYIWNTIQKDLPVLKKFCCEYLAK